MKAFIWSLLIVVKIAHPEIVLKQAMLETNNFRSHLCVDHNNLFGIKKGAHYAYFSSFEESVTYYAKHISPRYHGGDYYRFLKRIGYAADRRYIAKLRKINTRKMKEAIIMETTRGDLMAYVRDTAQIAPLVLKEVAICCGEPIRIGKQVDVSGRLVTAIQCCGSKVTNKLGVGDIVKGDLNDMGSYTPIELVVGSSNIGPHTTVEGSDNLFD